MQAFDAKINNMCQWYAHHYNCKHTTYALGKYCSSASLVQTPCKKKDIWQGIRMGVDCEECAMPEDRVIKTEERVTKARVVKPAGKIKVRRV